MALNKAGGIVSTEGTYKELVLSSFTTTRVTAKNPAGTAYQVGASKTFYIGWFTCNAGNGTLTLAYDDDGAGTNDVPLLVFVGFNSLGYPPSYFMTINHYLAAIPAGKYITARISGGSGSAWIKGIEL